MASVAVTADPSMSIPDYTARVLVRLRNTALPPRDTAVTG